MMECGKYAGNKYAGNKCFGDHCDSRNASKEETNLQIYKKVIRYSRFDDFTSCDASNYTTGSNCN